MTTQTEPIKTKDCPGTVFQFWFTVLSESSHKICSRAEWEQYVFIPDSSLRSFHSSKIQNREKWNTDRNHLDYWNPYFRRSTFCPNFVYISVSECSMNKILKKTKCHFYRMFIELSGVGSALKTYLSLLRKFCSMHRYSNMSIINSPQCKLLKFALSSDLTNTVKRKVLSFSTTFRTIAFDNVFLARHFYRIRFH